MVKWIEIFLCEKLHLWSQWKHCPIWFIHPSIYWPSIFIRKFHFITDCKYTCHRRCKDHVDLDCLPSGAWSPVNKHMSIDEVTLKSLDHLEHVSLHMGQGSAQVSTHYVCILLHTFHIMLVMSFFVCTARYPSPISVTKTPVCHAFSFKTTATRNTLINCSGACADIPT